MNFKVRDNAIPIHSVVVTCGITTTLCISAMCSYWILCLERRLITDVQEHQSWLIILMANYPCESDLASHHLAHNVASAADYPGNQPRTFHYPLHSVVIAFKLYFYRTQAYD